MVGCPRLKYASCQYLLESSLEHTCSCRGMHAAIAGLCKGLAGVLEALLRDRDLLRLWQRNTCVTHLSAWYSKLERQLSFSRKGASSAEARMLSTATASRRCDTPKGHWLKRYFSLSLEDWPCRL